MASSSSSSSRYEPLGRTPIMDPNAADDDDDYYGRRSTPAADGGARGGRDHSSQTMAEQQQQQQQQQQQRPHLPVLIIPGFMSSGLYVEESDLKPHWVGERIWLNLVALGFESLNLFGTKSDVVVSTNNDEDNHITNNPLYRKIHHATTTTMTTMTTTSRPTAPGGTTTTTTVNRDNKQPPKQPSPTTNDLNNGNNDKDDDDDDDDDDGNDDNHYDEVEQGRSSSNNNNNNNTAGTLLRSMWLHHMALSHTDMMTEHDGVKVRNIRGLHGVDYLTPGTLTNFVSYVFGPVIRALEDVGYQEGIHLDAAPYDWRLPPSQLEERDSYFTRTMEQIEHMVETNHGLAVVLVCHSLGCKVGHYFLNFALQTKGQGWIDKHIHTYMPVGGPHLGAPKALRSTVTGDKMSLDAFLSDSEALLLGRSFGSGPFLYPTVLPPDATPSVFVRNDGAIQIQFIGAMDVSGLLDRRDPQHIPKRLKMMVVYNGMSCSTSFQPLDPTTHIVQFDETITLRTVNPNGIPPPTTSLTILLCEPGLRVAKKSTSNFRQCRLQCRDKCLFQRWHCTYPYWWDDGKNCSAIGPIHWFKYLFLWHLLSVVVRYSVELSIKIAFGVTYIVMWCIGDGVVLTANEVSKVSGQSSIMAAGKVLNLRSALFGGGGHHGTPNGPSSSSSSSSARHLLRTSLRNLQQEAMMEEGGHGGGGGEQQRTKTFHIPLDLVYYSDRIKCCGKKRKTSIQLRITTIKAAMTMETTDTSPVCMSFPDGRSLDIVSSESSSSSSSRRRKTNSSALTPPTIKYAPRSGLQLMSEEGIQESMTLIQNVYDTDPLGPRGLSSENAPPVKLIKAIYGINLPTEVGAVYRRETIHVGRADKASTLLSLDTTAESGRANQDRGHQVVPATGYIIEGGIIKETKDTPQLIKRATTTTARTSPNQNHDDEDGFDDEETGVSTTTRASNTNNTTEEEDFIYTSGDGTVPYWSLQHPRTWSSNSCHVSIDELDGAEHREILADSRFHRILIDYVCRATKTS